MTAERVLILNGPIASGKSTVAEALAAESRTSGSTAAVVGLDLVYAMLQQAALMSDPHISRLARRAAAALVEQYVWMGSKWSLSSAISELWTTALIGCRSGVVTLHAGIEESFVGCNWTPAGGCRRSPNSWVRAIWHRRASADRLRYPRSRFQSRPERRPDYQRPVRPGLQWTIAGVVNPARSYFDPLGPDYVQHLVPMLKQYEAVGMQDPTVGFHSVTAGRQGLIAGQRFGDDVTHIVAAPPPADRPGFGGQRVAEQRRRPGATGDLDAVAAA